MRRNTEGSFAARPFLFSVRSLVSSHVSQASLKNYGTGVSWAAAAVGGEGSDGGRQVILHLLYSVGITFPYHSNVNFMDCIHSNINFMFLELFESYKILSVFLHNNSFRLFVNDSENRLSTTQSHFLGLVAIGVQRARISIF